MRMLAGLALVLLAGAPHAETRAVQQGENDLANVALELDSLNRGAARENTTRRLKALGAPTLFEALSRDELALGQGVLALGAREREVLLAGARLIGRAPFVPLWSEGTTAKDARRRTTTIELIGALGDASDLAQAVLAATPEASTDRPPEGASQALERAATELLQRQPSAFDTARGAIPRVHPGLADALIHALASVGGTKALNGLALLLGMKEALELPLLSQIARVAGALDPPFDAGLCLRVRSYLGHADRQIARASAMALAQLQDPESVPELLRMASKDDAVLSSAAFVALERTTALDLPRRAARWEAWFSSEVEWFRGSGRQLQAACTSQDPLVVVAALRELARHRLDRARSAARAAECLKHADERVRAEACRTLAALRFGPASAELRAAEDDPSPLVVEAAGMARRSLDARP